VTTQAHIEYWPPVTTTAETAALRWLAGYRHGTVNKPLLAEYYLLAGGTNPEAAAGRMWRRLVGKLLLDADARALTPAGIEAANR
jgi:hypothetical protein